MSASTGPCQAGTTLHVKYLRVLYDWPSCIRGNLTVLTYSIITLDCYVIPRFVLIGKL